MALLVTNTYRDIRAGTKRLQPALPTHLQPHPNLPPTHPSWKLGLGGGWGRTQAPGASAFPRAWLTQKHVMKADITSNTIRSFG